VCQCHWQCGSQPRLWCGHCRRYSVVDVVGAERVDEDTQAEIAEDLGVSQKTVSRAVDELPEDVKSIQVNKVNSLDKKEVREYVEDNPDAGNREVARAVGLITATAGGPQLP